MSRQSPTLAHVKEMVDADPWEGVCQFVKIHAVRIYHNRQDEFLRTSCEATADRVRHLIEPDDSRWVNVEVAPTDGRPFIVSFDTEHYLAVLDGSRVLQSYAFRHEVQETPYDSTKPLHSHISRDQEHYACMTPEIFALM